MIRTKRQAKAQLTEDDALVVWEAAEWLRPRLKPSDLPFLVSAYERVKDYITRIEIVDLAGKISGATTCAFLLSVAQSKDRPLVRYYAMRNMIEHGCDEWRPRSKRMRESDFYASLIAYERYLRRQIDLEALRALAASGTRRVGDHWYWLTMPFGEPSATKGRDEPPSAST